MKRLFAPILALLALAPTLFGCAKPDDSQEYFDSLDGAKPGYTAFQQSLLSITHPVGALVMALNLNHYITTPEDQKMFIEDLYYHFYKVREAHPNFWQIYDTTWEEIYQLENGLTLDQEGAEWKVWLNPRFFGKEATGGISIRTTAPDTHTITLKNVQTPIHVYSPSMLLAAQHTGETRYTAYVECELTVKSNRSAYDRGEAEHLILSIEGTGSFADRENKSYGCQYTITTPLVGVFNTSGTLAAPLSGAMDIYISANTHTVRHAEVTMERNVIKVFYEHSSGVRRTSYYDWGSQNITPR